MRPLSATLQAAQQAGAFVPAVRLHRRRVSAGEDRYSPVGPSAYSVSGAGATAPAAGNGTLTLYTVAQGAVRSTPFTGTPPAAGNTAVLWACTDNLLAACQSGGTSAVVTSGQNGTPETTVRVHLNQGGGFTISETVTLPAAVQQLACAFAPDGRLFIAAIGSAKVMVTIRTGTNSYAAVVQSTESFSAPTGIACCYSKTSQPGDLVLYVSAAFTAGYSQIGGILFGDGDQRSVGSFSTHVDALLVKPYVAASSAGTVLTAAGAVLVDTLRFTFFEDFQNPLAGVATKRNYLQSAFRAYSITQGFYRDPQPLPIDSASPLRPAYDASTGRLFFANNAAVYYADAPATTDLSSRVLRAVRTEAESGSRASILLDNADGGLTAMAQDPNTIGERLNLDFGYATSAGAEYSPGPPLWISAMQLSSHAGTRYAEITASDAWHLLAAWKPRRLYSWTPSANTLLYFIQWLLARAGIDFTPPQRPSALLNTNPAFSLHPSTSGAQALHELLDQVPEVLSFTAAGGALLLPQAADAAVYSYAPPGHQALASRLSLFPEPLNHVLLFGNASGSDTAPSLIAEAIDAADVLRIADYPHVVSDRQVSVANAAARAAVPLRKAQLVTDAGEIGAAPNVGLELWDPIAITEPGVGWSAATKRVRAIETHYDTLRDGGVYTQSVGVMNV